MLTILYTLVNWIIGTSAVTVTTHVLEYCDELKERIIYNYIIIINVFLYNNNN